MRINKSYAVSHVDGLLRLYDVAFVECGYWTLLGRAADPEGRNGYLTALRSGRSKLSIIDEICSSQEGRNFSSDLPGLDKVLGRYRKSRLPVIGFFCRQLWSMDGNSASDRKLRAIENAVYSLKSSVEQRLAGAETPPASKVSEGTTSPENARTLTGGFAAL